MLSQAGSAAVGLVTTPARPALGQHSRSRPRCAPGVAGDAPRAAWPPAQGPCLRSRPPRGLRPPAAAAARRAGAALVADAADAVDPVAAAARGLEALQQLAAGLQAEPTADGLLAAFQQQRAVQRAVLAAQRRCQAAIHRTRWAQSRSSRQASRADGGAPAAAGAQSGAAAAGAGAAGGFSSVEAAAQLAQLRELRSRCDDALDLLIALTAAHLQGEPPVAATRLLTAAASRQLNAAALNRACVDAFLAKQRLASPGDMAGLMAALALVRCCSADSQQVEGLEQHQLAALFGGTMTHLVAYVERALPGGGDAGGGGESGAGGGGQQQLQQQQQQQRTRRAAAAAGGGSPDDLRRQVAAGVAAHVSARVPLATPLIAHIIHLLGDQAPAWLHPVAQLGAAESVTELAGLVAHPARYDYTYLAAALQRLSELTEAAAAAAAAAAAGAPPACAAGAADAAAGLAAGTQLAAANRLARRLFGRLHALRQDATAAELAAVLAAAARMGVADGGAYAGAALQFVGGPQLASATDAQLASVMHAVATWHAISGGGGGGGGGGAFPRAQQQAVVKACARQLCALLSQQRRAGAAPAAAGGEELVAPGATVMAVWAMATAGSRMPQALVGRLFAHLLQPATLARLVGGGAGPARDEVARTCCTVLWAAAELQAAQGMAVARAFTPPFMAALPSVPAACGSIGTVLQALAALLAAARRRDAADAAAAAPGGAPAPPAQRAAQLAGEGEPGEAWAPVFLHCTDELLARLQQQAPGSDDAAGDGAGGDGGAAVAPVADAPGSGAGSGACSVSAAWQVVWAFQVAGITLPDAHVAPLLRLLGDQSPAWLLEAAVVRAASPAALLALLEGRAAAAADAACVGAALQRLAGLAVPADADAGECEAARQCCRRLSALAAGVPELQDGTAAGAAASANPAAAAAAAASIVWGAAQLAHRDVALSSGALRLFLAAAPAASPADATRVVAAMAAAGRALPSIYRGCDASTLQAVLRACTATLLSTEQGAAAAEQPASGGGGSGRGRRGGAAQEPGHAAAAAALPPGEPGSAALAQRLLALHAVLGLAPEPAALQALLGAVADERALDRMRPNEAAGLLVAALGALAELAALPPALAERAEHGGGRAPERAGWDMPRLLLQALLLDGILPRVPHATASMVATSLQAAAALAEAGGGAAPPPALRLELPLARDFARALLRDLVAPPGAAEPGAFLQGWKGEHVAAAAVAALRLGVASPAFFDAVAADVLCLPGGAAAGGPPRRRPRLQRVALPHLAVVCCAAAALHCRVDALLEHTLGLACAALGEAGAAAPRPWPARARRQQVAADADADADALQQVLLAWAAAQVDAPQLLPQAQALAAAGVAALGAGGDEGWLHELPGAAPRLAQLHVWLSDRGVAAPLLPAPQLHVAREAWLALQAAAPGGDWRLSAVADALAQLPGLDAGPALHAVTPDGWLAADLKARVGGVRVALLLLDDADEDSLVAAARDQLAQQRAGGGGGGGGGAAAARPAPAAGGGAGARAVGGALGALAACLARPQVGDVMFRARALAARGSLVSVLSWQDFARADGHLGAELDALAGKLWMLRDRAAAAADADGGRVASGVPVAAVASVEEA
ncbi:hypothetical protein HT031_006310 [Scenedesmus sp. PABB004]|nr:hypothetical protein HT031_006310 [Scenedesmus sp. PABB004]